MIIQKHGQKGWAVSMAICAIYSEISKDLKYSYQEVIHEYREKNMYLFFPYLYAILYYSLLIKGYKFDKNNVYAASLVNIHILYC